MRIRALGVALILLFSLTGCKVVVSKYWFNKGNTQFKEGKFSEAIAMYDKAIEAQPDYKLAHFYRGMAYYTLYKPGIDDQKNKTRATEAMLSLGKVLEIDPNNKDAMLTLADLYDKQGNEGEALRLFLRRIEMNPEEPSGYYKLADYFSKHGDNAKAVDTYEKRIALDPNNPEGYLYLANFFSNLPEPEFDKAIEQHKKRIPLLGDDNDLKQAWYSIAVVAWAKSFRSPNLTSEERLATVQGGYEAADNALKIDPEYPEALIYKGLLVREEAKMKTTDAERNALIDQAKSLSEQAMAIRKRQKEAEAAAAAAAAPAEE